MNTRQALIVLSLLAGLSACTPSNDQLPTPTAPPPIPTATVPPTPIPPTPIPPTPTALTCLAQPGRIKQESLDATKPPQEFLVYLPPCYNEMTDLEYPVLYLLHGQTYTADQWIRMGTGTIADLLIISGETVPFIIVFPDDRYWNLPPGPGFGERVVELVIPFVDENYRTLADREHRAIGGLSRGGGWAARLGFSYPGLFGSIGLHSPAIFNEDYPSIKAWISDIGPNGHPRLWLDVGDRDTYLGYSRTFVELLTSLDYPYEFHVYAGDHTEGYWGRHTEEYLRWYAEGWSEQGEEQ